MVEKAALSRREKYAEETRGALLDAAREAFVEDGFQKASIETIARRAHVTRGAFYHHFQDKQALFAALVIELQADAAARISTGASSEGAPIARLVSGVRTFLEICVEPPYRRLVIQDAPAVLGSRHCREIAETYAFGLMGRALEGLKAAGLIDVDNPALAGRMIGSMVCEAALLLEDAQDQRQLKQQALEIVERAIIGLSSVPKSKIT